MCYKPHATIKVVFALAIFICVGFYNTAIAQTAPLFGTSGSNASLNWNNTSTTVTRKIGWTFKSPGTGYICGFNTVLTHDQTGTPDPNEYLVMNFWSHGDSRAKPEQNILVASKSFANDTLVEKDSPTEGVDDMNFMFDNCVLISQGGWYSLHFEGTFQPTSPDRLYWSRSFTVADPECVDCWRNRQLQGVWEENDDVDWLWTALGYGGDDFSIFDEPASGDYGFDPDQDFGFFGNMLRDIGKFLFIPSESALNQWESTKERLFERVPFSYFEEVQEMVDDTVASPSAFPSFAIDLTPHGLNASGSLFGKATIEKYLPGNDIGYFRIFMESVLYILFGMYIWHTVRDLLHRA